MRKLIFSLCILASIPAIATASLSSASILAPSAGIEGTCSGNKDKSGCGGEKSSVTSPTTFGGGCCPGKGGKKDGGKSDA